LERAIAKLQRISIKIRIQPQNHDSLREDFATALNKTTLDFSEANQIHPRGGLRKVRVAAEVEGDEDVSVEMVGLRLPCWVQ
jgi:hypothetical protein